MLLLAIEIQLVYVKTFKAWPYKDLFYVLNVLPF